MRILALFKNQLLYIGVVITSLALLLLQNSTSSILASPTRLKNSPKALGIKTAVNSSSGGSSSSSIIYHGSRDKKRVALTFDAEMTDGMKYALLSGKTKSSYDKRIVDTLKQTDTKATLFLTGMWIELYPNIAKELAANPLFEIGSHSYTDSSFDGYCFGLKQLTEDQERGSIRKTQTLLKTVAGIDNHLFRFPGGCSSQEDIKIVNEFNLSPIRWDVSGGDGFNNNPKLIEQRAIDGVQNGSIIVLHLNGSPNAPMTAEALPIIISSLKNRGYEFVKVSELLNRTVALR